MRSLVISLCLLALAASASGQALADLDAFLAAERPRSGVPGLTYAVIDGDAVRAGMNGVIATGTGAPGDVDTPFVLGSIAKSFTALAVMILVEAGDVELDAPIADYLPEFTGQASGAISIRQLLSHTSGFSTLQGNRWSAEPGPGESALTGQLAAIAGWAPAHPPGERWAYSNANYVILGALIEEVSGLPYGAYIQSEILEPAGMANSFVADGARHDVMAIGHRPWFGAKRAMAAAPTDPVSAPAGGVIATAEDLGRYLAMMMNGRDDIVTAQTKAAMMAPASAVSPFYGFGWFIDARSGEVYHGGLSPGVETLAVMVPTQRRAALVLVNANGGVGFGESAGLLAGFTARALDMDAPVVTGVWSRKALVLVFVLSPLLFMAGLIQALRGRAGLRAKSGAAGLLSLWFPLIMTAGLAVTCLVIIPALYGTPLGNLRRFQPDLAMLMIATALTGLIWAAARLALAYGPRWRDTRWS